MHCSIKHGYSITSSAVASSVGGIVNPSALAVLPLMTRLKSCRRLHWKIGRFFSFEDTVDVVRCWPEVTSDVNAIGGKGACHRVCTVGHGSSLIGSEAANNAPTKERGGRRRVS